MRSSSIRLSIALWLSCLLVWNCTSNKTSDSSIEAEAEIRQIHSDYVDGWIHMDEERVMGLMEENAMIQPNRFKPIEGKSEIRMFWFPNDSSKTTINKFETEILSLNIFDTLAVTTHNSILDWTYQKDTLEFGMIQKGINTTVYRQQKDKSWKIWRSMWTDLYFENK